MVRVLRVFPPRHPKVVLAVTTRTIAVEEKPSTIRREIRDAGFIARNIDIGPEVERMLPVGVQIFPLSDPDLGESPTIDAAGPVGGEEKLEEPRGRRAWCRPPRPGY